jgi:hypothetical protein
MSVNRKVTVPRWSSAVGHPALKGRVAEYLRQVARRRLCALPLRLRRRGLARPRMPTTAGAELDALTRAEQDFQGLIGLQPNPPKPGARLSLPGFDPEE